MQPQQRCSAEAHPAGVNAALCVAASSNVLLTLPTLHVCIADTLVPHKLSVAPPLSAPNLLLSTGLLELGRRDLLLSFLSQALLPYAPPARGGPLAAGLVAAGARAITQPRSVETCLSDTAAVSSLCCLFFAHTEHTPCKVLQSTNLPCTKVTATCADAVVCWRSCVPIMQANAHQG